VYKAIHLPTGGFVAIKKVSNPFNNFGDARRLLREFLILKTLKKQKNVVKFYELLKSAEEDYLK
jgi:serine/threonine protein kinase